MIKPVHAASRAVRAHECRHAGKIGQQVNQDFHERFSVRKRHKVVRWRARTIWPDARSKRKIYKTNRREQGRRAAAPINDGAHAGRCGDESPTHRRKVKDAEQASRKDVCRPGKDGLILAADE